MIETPPLAVNPTHLAALTPDGRATFADALAKGGYKADAIAAALDQPAPAKEPVKPAAVTLGLAGGPTVGSLEAERIAATEVALAAPAEYSLTHVNANSISASDLAAQDAEYKSGFAHMQLPGSVAQVLADALSETAAHYNRPNATAEEMNAEFLSEGSKISRMTNSAEIVRLSEVAQAAMSPEFKASLYNKFALHSASAMVALAHAGRLLEMKGEK